MPRLAADQLPPEAQADFPSPFSTDSSTSRQATNRLRGQLEAKAGKLFLDGTRYNLVIYLLFQLFLFGAPDARAAKLKPLAACDITYAKLDTSAKEPDIEAIQRIVDEEFESNLFWMQQKTSPEFAAVWNKEILRELDSLPLPEGGKRFGSLTGSEIDALYKRIIGNPISSGPGRFKYDPDGKIGFCFGRAFTAHMEALRAGLDEGSIRKIWAVGDMGQWGHHVATMVRRSDGAWVVLDPNNGTPYTLAEWFSYIKAKDKKNTLQIFTTAPSRFGPADNLPILPSTVSNDYYNGYFKDLTKYFRDETAKVLEQRRASMAILDNSSER